MFDVDLLVAVTDRLILGGSDGLLQFFGEAIEVHESIVAQGDAAFRPPRANRMLPATSAGLGSFRNPERRIVFNS
jgi:hypothetical protein